MRGREVGGYRLEEPLGKGGMGVIHRAVHVTTGQVAAVKMLHPRLTKDESVRERFLREAQAQARLSHPHIAEILSLVEKGGIYYIIMEYLEGETLLQYLRRSGPLPIDEGLSIFRQVLDAVSHAHGLGVLHRDLKPANVMLLSDGIAKVTDFGTAKILDAESLTLAGTALGSPLYMSPEQLRGEPLDEAIDVYSLGITLYQICTGEVPYEGESLASLLRHLRDNEPIPPSRHLPSIDPALEKIILRGIARKKEERFPTAKAFRDALDAYRMGGAPGPVRADREAPLSAREMFSPRVLLLAGMVAGVLAIYTLLARRPILAMGGIALYIPALIVLIYLVTSPGRPRRCARCRRAIPKGWKSCLFCEKGVPGDGLRAALFGTDALGQPLFWQIPEGTVVLGRKAPSEIVLEDDEVSTRHAEIRHLDHQLTIQDLGSTNGTTLNGARLQANKPAPIYNGDRVGLGKTILTVEAEPPG